MVSKDFRRQLEGYGLTTARIFYRRPDHLWLLQTYVWQDYDLFPNFPTLQKFLAFWQKSLDGPVQRARSIGDGGLFRFLCRQGRNEFLRQRDPIPQVVIAAPSRIHPDKSLHATAVHFHDGRARPRQSLVRLLLADAEQKTRLAGAAQHVISLHEADAAEHLLLGRAWIGERAAQAIGQLLIVGHASAVLSARCLP
jgi:uncharacterized protein Usg